MYLAGLCEWRHTLLNPGVASVPATIAVLSMWTLGNDRDSQGKRLTAVPRAGHPSYLVALLCRGQPSVQNLHVIADIFMFLAITGICLHLFLSCLSQPISSFFKKNYLF